MRLFIFYFADDSGGIVFVAFRAGVMAANQQTSQPANQPAVQPANQPASHHESEVEGVAETGNRFVSCVRARGAFAWCDPGQKGCSCPFPFSRFAPGAFPFSLVSSNVSLSLSETKAMKSLKVCEVLGAYEVYEVFEVHGGCEVHKFIKSMELIKSTKSMKSGSL